MRNKRLWTVVVLVVTMLVSSVLPAFAAPAPPPPFPTKVVKEDRGREITILSGFDLAEYGGDDSRCTRTELDAVVLREEVGSADEACKVIVEWSLKNGDETIASGFFAMEPRIWFRFVEAYEATNGPVRFVGTIWYLPKGWNAHMLAANMAADWQVKNPDLITYVGLSPTDPWVQGLWKAAEAGSTSVEAAAPTNEEEAMYCTVTSGKARVNVRNGPGLNFGVVRTVRTGTEITYFGQTESEWKIIGEEEFMLGTLCVDAEQADG